MVDRILGSKRSGPSKQIVGPIHRPGLTTGLDQLPQLIVERGIVRVLAKGGLQQLARFTPSTGGYQRAR